MNKVAVVTGSAKGLGRSIALWLADQGYTLVVHFKKSRKEAEVLLSQLRKKSPQSLIVQADLTREREVGAMFDSVFKKFSRVDLLVNNVGDFIYKEFAETTNAEFRDVLETNLYATLFCSRAVLPQMRKQKFGQIINIGAVGAERITLRAKSVPYFLAKNGVYVLTKAMAYDEAKNGVRVNMISPGSMAVDIFSKKDFPMGREAKHEDVIDALKFLISDEAYYINGANIEVAGGFIPGYT